MPPPRQGAPCGLQGLQSWPKPFAQALNTAFLVRLASEPLAPMPCERDSPIADKVLSCTPLRIARSHNFQGDVKHVNLQEIEAVAEVTDRLGTAGLRFRPQRDVNWSDSKVTIVAWAMGRSSAFTIKGSLR